MVMNPTAPAKVEIWKQVNDADLRVFLAFTEDLTTSLGISHYKMYKDAGLNINYTSSIKRILAGKKQYKKAIYLHTIIHLCNVHGFSFNLDKYRHILEASKLPQEPKKG